jgi:hypothetical protein
MMKLTERETPVIVRLFKFGVDVRLLADGFECSQKEIEGVIRAVMIEKKEK